MKICVCFKIVPDLDRVLEGDWRNAGLELDTSYVKKGFNCYDEGALEMALRLSKLAGTDTQCTALTVGGGLTNILKGLYAVGYDEVVNIPFEDREFCSEVVAELLAAFIKKQNFDLILTGSQSAMADTGMVPPLLAEHLGWPLIEGVREAGLEAEDFCFTCERVEGVERVRVKGPILASVGEAIYPYLRVPTLRQKMAAAKRPIDEIFVNNTTKRQKMPEFKTIKKEKHCHFLEGENVEQKTMEFFDQVVKGVLE